MANYQPVPEHLIKEQFAEFLNSAEGGALAPINNIELVLDKETRYCVAGDQNKRESAVAGEYCIHSDGCPAGYAINYKYSSDAVKWRFDFKALKGDKQYDKYYAMSQTPEFKAEAKRVQDEHKEQEARAKAEGLANAKAEFNNAPKLINPELKYLKNKKVGIHGELKSDKYGNILLPLRNIRGEFKSMQRILPDGSKRFAKDTSTSGAFFNIDLDKAKDDTSKPIIICEGYATGATLYEITGCPVVCAISCYGIDKTAEALRKEFKQHKIIIMADNDAETARKQGNNPGLDHADAANKKYKLDGVFAPQFDAFLQADGKSDWNDYFCEYGEEKTRAKLNAHLKWASMSEEQREDYSPLQVLLKCRTKLDKNAPLQQQETIAGMFPRDYVSVIVAAPGIGKTWNMQKLVDDLSLGGPILNGFAYEPKPLKSLIFEGEAGEQLLLKRAKLTQWDADIDKVIVYDQDKIFLETGKTLMINSPAGFKHIIVKEL